MNNLRAFKVTTLPPTNHRPVRIKITDLRFDETVIIGYTATSSSTQNKRAIEFLSEKGIEVTAQAWREIDGHIHDYTLLLTENFNQRIK